MLLDTTFIIDLLRGDNPAALHRAEELDQRFESKGVASITIMELWRGALQSNQPDREKRKIAELISSLLAYPFQEMEAKKAAEIEVDLIKRGEMIDLEDIMIAGVAQVHNEPVLTRNLKHFSKIRDISLELY